MQNRVVSRVPNELHNICPLCTLCIRRSLFTPSIRSTVASRKIQNQWSSGVRAASGSSYKNQKKLTTSGTRRSDLPKGDKGSYPIHHRPAKAEKVEKIKKVKKAIQDVEDTSPEPEPKSLTFFGKLKGYFFGNSAATPPPTQTTSEPEGASSADNARALAKRTKKERRKQKRRIEKETKDKAHTESSHGKDVGLHDAEPERTGVQYSGDQIEGAIVTDGAVSTEGAVQHDDGSSGQPDNVTRLENLVRSRQQQVRILAGITGKSIQPRLRRRRIALHACQSQLNAARSRSTPQPALPDDNSGLLSTAEGAELAADHLVTAPNLAGTGASIDADAAADTKQRSLSSEIEGYSTLEKRMRTSVPDSEEDSSRIFKASPAGKSHKLAPVSITAKKLDFAPLPIHQPPVPTLAHGLDRVLFNSGVHQLQDSSSRVYNFDPYLQRIMPVAEFDFDALKQYKTSSQDEQLSTMARKYDKKYVGSTSSMTSTLGHFHYLLSNWRPLNFSMLSRGFPESLTSFTELNRAPNAMFLRWKKGTYAMDAYKRKDKHLVTDEVIDAADDGTYAIDADKQYDGANVLMLLGKSMEKLLTLPPSSFERYRKSDPREISEAERTDPEAYHYSTQGDMLMRSQLDAQDTRLPGTGMFDLKTRAVLSVRMRSDEYEEMSGYQITSQRGQYESFEREYYDMARSTLLKYSLQARMGRMDGIFLAYHNVERVFGFQYMNMAEIDQVLHGQSDPCLGDQEFKLSLDLMNKVLNMATNKFPKQSIRFHFETRPTTTEVPFMYIYAEPMSEPEIDRIQDSQKASVAEAERVFTATEGDAGLADEKSDGLPSTAAVETFEEAVTADEGVEAANQESAATTEPSSVDEDAVIDAPLDDLPNDIGSTTSNAAASTTKSEPPKKARAPASSPKFEYGPLLALSLVLRHTVNGTTTSTRPKNLSPEDDWSVQATFTEMRPQTAWSTYTSCKDRRRKLLGRDSDLDKSEDGSSKDKAQAHAEWEALRRRRERGDGYIEMLRLMSARGREARTALDEKESNMQKVVLGQPSPESAGSSEVSSEKSGVEDRVSTQEDPMPQVDDAVAVAVGEKGAGNAAGDGSSETGEQVAEQPILKEDDVKVEDIKVEDTNDQDAKVDDAKVEATESKVRRGQGPLYKSS